MFKSLFYSYFTVSSELKFFFIFKVLSFTTSIYCISQQSTAKMLETLNWCLQAGVSLYILTALERTHYCIASSHLLYTRQSHDNSNHCVFGRSLAFVNMTTVCLEGASPLWIWQLCVCEKPRLYEYDHCVFGRSLAFMNIPLCVWEEPRLYKYTTVCLGGASPLWIWPLWVW